MIIKVLYVLRFKICLFLLFILLYNIGQSQTKLQVVSDSVRVSNAELVIRNKTKNTPGVLVNKGNGITEFRNLKFVKSGDSTFFIYGQDTTAVTATGGGYVYESSDKPVSLNISVYDGTTMKLRWAKTSNDFYVSPKIGIIGDSQGKGDYASSYSNSTMGRLQNFIYATCQNAVVINYCQNGYNSRRLAPTGSNAYVDNQYNITKALADGNKIIILCNTGNDFLPSGAGGPVPVSESMANTLLIADACQKAGATLFVMSTNPAAARPVELRDSARTMAELLRKKFGERCAYTYKLLENPAIPNTLIPSLQLSDEIHLNDAGCAVLFGAVRDLLIRYYASDNMIAGYELQKATSFSGIYSNLQFISSPGEPTVLLAKDSAFYRVRIKYHNGYYSDWSNISQGTTAYQEAPPELPPLVTGNGPIKVSMPKDSTTLIVTASDPNAGGSIQSYRWFRVTGNSLATILNSTQASTRVTGLTEGNYVFRCEVKNALNKVAFIDVPVIVAWEQVYPRAQFDFGSGAHSYADWVDVSGAPLNVATDNKSWTHNATGIGIKNISSTSLKWGANYASTGNAGDASGETVDDGGGFAVPATVLKSAWYSNLKSYTDSSSNQLKIFGLSPASRYTVRMYPSMASTFTVDADPTEFVVNNNVLNKKQVNAKTNTSNAAVFRGIVPAADGTVSVFVGVPAGQAQFGMLNALTVEEEAPAANMLPTVIAGSNKTIQLPVNVASVSVMAQDPDGPITSIVWTRYSGPTSAVISNNGALDVNVNFTEAGTYVFRCTVTDQDGGSGYADVTVTVLADSGIPALKIGVSKLKYTEPGWRVVYGSPHVNYAADTSMFAGNEVIVTTINKNNWSAWSNNTVSSDSTGAITDDGGGFSAPARVIQGCFFNDNQYNASIPQMEVRNLPAGTYKVTLFGSLKNGLSTSVNCQTEYRVNSSGPITVDARGNTSHTAVFTGQIVGSDGTLKIYFNPITPNSLTYAGLLNYIIVEKTN
ncbi:MAG: hypothetical protein DI535_14035 [Citrobacter freundii]|nr:MAG: hypothetical protein DI535_14035 [Citrobacter freundii]